MHKKIKNIDKMQNKRIEIILKETEKIKYKIGSGVSARCIMMSD